MKKVSIVKDITFRASHLAFDPPIAPRTSHFALDEVRSTEPFVEMDPNLRNFKVQSTEPFVERDPQPQKFQGAEHRTKQRSLAGEMLNVYVHEKFLEESISNYITPFYIFLYRFLTF